MRQEPQRARFSFGERLTPAVRVLLWINGLTYLFLLLAGHQTYEATGQTYADLLVSLLGLSPRAVFGHFALWQPITYIFIHRSFFHVLFNLLGVYWFGADIETAWGSRAFIRYYFFTGIGAGIVSALFGISTIGASGAVFGLLLAYGLLFPNRVLYIYGLIPLKAKYCVLFFGLFEFLMMLGTGGSEINHIAHLSGISFGLAWFGFYRRELNVWDFWKRFRRSRMRRKLRLIRRRSDRDDGPDSAYSNQTIH